MKLLRVISSLDPKNGGPIEGLVQTTRILEQRGVAVTVLCSDDPKADWLAQYTFPIVATGPTKGTYRYNKELSKWLDANLPDFDEVIVHGVWQFHSFATFLACKKHKQRYYIFTHGMLDPWFKETYPIKHIKKWLYWPWAEYRVLKSAEAVLFTSQEEMKRARQSFWLYKCTEKTVRYGIPTPAMNRESAISEFATNFTSGAPESFILYLSRIHEKKGVDLLVEAYQKITDSTLCALPDLVIAGPCHDVALLDALKTETKNNLKIHYLPMLQGDEKWGAFFASDVFILPSHQENFGIVVAEALSTGTPVLTTDKVNIWNEIEAGGCGFIEKDTLRGVENLLRKWLDTSQPERVEMSRHALSTFQTNFEIENAVDDLVRLFTR